MAASKCCDARDYLSGPLTLKILSKYKYGVASVSTISGKGRFIVDAIVKRSRKQHSKPVYDFAYVILDCIEGEIIDGIFKSSLKEKEVLRMRELHIGPLFANWTRLMFVPAEEAAAFCVIPLHEKAVGKGFAGFLDKHAADAFECFREVAQHCSYQSVEEFLNIGLGKADPRGLDRSKFNGYRAELQAWLLMKDDLTYHNCPLPPPPPPQNLHHYYPQVTSWKETAAKKLSSALNYERFCGMAKHQALWYAWAGDMDRANVMVDALRGLQDDQKKGRPLDTENIVVSIILHLSYCNLIDKGLYEGCSIPDPRLTPDERCLICLVKATNKMLGLNLLTCVDKDGKGEFGSYEVRNDLAKLFFAIFKLGTINPTIENTVQHLFKKAIHTFLSHAFANQFWLSQPTVVMAEKTEVDILAGFAQEISGKSPGELNVCQLAQSCKAIIGETLLKNCGSKLGAVEIEKMSKLFETKFKKVITEFNKLVDEESSLEPNSGTLNAEKICRDLYLNYVVPVFAERLKTIWRFLSSSKKEKVLTRESQLVHQSCSEAFVVEQESRSGHGDGSLVEDTQEQVHVEGEKQEDQEKNEDVEDNKGCSEDSCACKDAKKFEEHLVNVLSSTDNPVPFYKCLLNGDVMMNEELCIGKGEDYINVMPAFDCERVISTIEEIADERFAVCPVLASMCKNACERICVKFTKDLTRELSELGKRTNARFQWHSCQTCGQEESELGEFKLCGGCRNVFYCGKKCQAQDWKAGHKQKCKTSAREL